MKRWIALTLFAVSSMAAAAWSQMQQPHFTRGRDLHANQRRYCRIHARDFYPLPPTPESETLKQEKVYRA